MRKALIMTVHPVTVCPVIELPNRKDIVLDKVFLGEVLSV